MTYVHSHQRPSHRQRGFTMIELMIALLIGLFLMGGLLGILQSNKRAFTSQNQLSQLQDSERLAMMMLNDVIQQAGYFPDPTLNTALSTLAQSGSFAKGQWLTGSFTAGTGDTISVRYTTASGDGILNCTGGTNATGGNFTYVNTFSVIVNAAGVSQLVCTREDNTPYPLVNNVTKITALYGVNTSGSGDNVDTYMTAAQVTAAAAWNNVISVQVTLGFNNPLWGTPGQLNQYLYVTRNINIMAQTG
jgi:type IV pilus assembly protein PilW